MPKTSKRSADVETVDSDLAIRVQGVSKTFVLHHTHTLKETFVAFFKRKTLSSTFEALNGVSFDVRRGESVAVLGFNGSGKSTTLKLVAGIFPPDAGHVATRGRIAPLLEVGGGFHPDLTGRENVYLNGAILGMSQAEIQERYDSIVDFAEIPDFMDTEVKHYSSGMYVRLAFSVAIHVEHDILLADEVLSVGDERFQQKCFAKIDELKASGKTIFMVSHALDTIQKYCERGILIHDHRVAFDGPITEAIAAMRAM
ncbi:ABC transporter ATP-binding protein [Pseudolysinimonas sp.]|uniref:ABC transporter ATP-binding protein n=1 Tax=Pseudolysinimonas sp. TaxID=2680009 RepID=UPI003F8153C9